MESFICFLFIIIIVVSTMTFSVITAAENWLSGAYEKMVNNQDSNKTVGLTIRYYDIYHHGYTRLNKGDRIAVARTGKTMVKLLLEKILPEAVSQQDKLLVAITSSKEEDTEIFEDSDDEGDEFGETDIDSIPENSFEVLEKPPKEDEFYLVGDEDINSYENVGDGDFEILNHANHYKSKEYSRFVDVAKIPQLKSLNREQIERFSDAEKIRIYAWKKILQVPQSHKEVNSTIKKLIRKGIPEFRRKVFWMGITGATTLLKQQPNFYEKDFQMLYGSYKQADNSDRPAIESVVPRIVAEFGGNLPGYSYATTTIKTHRTYTEYLKSDGEFTDSEDAEPIDSSVIDREWFFLNPEGLNAAKRILCVLADQNPDIEYSPAIPEMVHILLMIMNEKQAYAAIHQMVKRSKKDSWYFRLNKIQNALFVETMKDIISKKIPNIAKHFEKIEFDLTKLATLWFKRLFISFLPLHMSLIMLDGFINEGSKVLYRTGYAILKTFEMKILECQSPVYMPLLITDLSLRMADSTEFFKKAYGLSLRRKHMKSLDEKNRENLDPLKLVGKVSTLVKPKLKSQSEIITDMSQWELLYSWLPYRQRVRALDLLFTTSKHGYSLSSLYNTCKDCGPCIFIILAIPSDVDDPDNEGLALTPVETVTHEIHPETHTSQIEEEAEDSSKIIELIKQQAREGKSLRKEMKKEEEEKQQAIKKEKKKPARMTIKDIKKKNTCIFGAYLGESFEPTYRYSGTTDTFLYSMYPVETRYKWSRKNDYFVMGRKDRLVIGGGGDGPGLQFDSMLSDGSSQACVTFENEPLAGSSTRFQILKLEVFWFT